MNLAPICGLGIGANGDDSPESHTVRSVSPPCQLNPQEIETVASSGELHGRPRGNVYAGLIPAVKAWAGPLPHGVIGFEFYTDVEPDPDCAPDWPEWSQGRQGVRILESDAMVAIDVMVSRRQDPK